MVAKLKVKDEHLKLKDKNKWSLPIKIELNWKITEKTNDNYVLYHP